MCYMMSEKNLFFTLLISLDPKKKMKCDILGLSEYREQNRVF
jgi:hypothetical protein